MTKKVEYYVYTLTDPRDNSIFYVGKGKGDRINDHFKELDKYLDLIEKGIPIRRSGVRFSNTNKTARMKVIREERLETIVQKLIENISENSAHALEEQLVERIGRKLLNNGPLLNLEPGGKWRYPKIVLTDEEKTSMKEIETNYPELLPIIENFPHTATESELEKRLKEKNEDDKSL